MILDAKPLWGATPLIHAADPEADGGGKRNLRPLSELVGRVHRSDCLTLMRSMRGGCAQMIFADPPFNLGKKYNSYNDNLEFSDYMRWTESWLAECARILRADGSLFLYNIPKLLSHTTPLLNELLQFRHWIAWNSNGQPLGKTLQPAHYGILFYTKTRRNKFYDVRAPHPRCRKCAAHLKDYGGKEYLRHPFGYQVSDVWSDIHRVRHNNRRIEGHPCQLPVHLIERMILMTTDANDIVFDPFCGGGSAAIAAKQMGRRYIGCDIDAAYVEAANRRRQAAKPVRGPGGIYLSKHLGKVVSARDADLDASAAKRSSPGYSNLNLSSLRRIDKNELQTLLQTMRRET